MIAQTIARLRQLTQTNVQANWRYCEEDLSIDAIAPDEWKIAEVNDKGYIVWSAGRRVRWLAQKFVVPNDLQGYPLEGLVLRLLLTWWADYVQIFVNGKLVQEGDLFESSVRLMLTPSAMPGEVITVALRLVSPGHDIGALMRSQLLYESDLQDKAAIDPSFVADELTVLHDYLTAFEPEKIDTLETSLEGIDWDLVRDRAKFDRALLDLRQNLEPLAIDLKKRCFHLLGHAHLDMAWLWPVSETWDAAQRTFASVLNLQKEFPELTFCHTSPVLYAWIEKHRPDLFGAIGEAVKAKSWEVLGGMWVEPEVNIISGESLVRQLLYGQRYIAEKFGSITKVAWLPDSFGFSWQLPQIFKQSGIEYFVTGKLHWNDTTQFPHGVFWWRSPDGTELLTLMSPPNKTGVMDTNPITMTDYAIAWEKQTGLQDAFWLPGVGDRGGGPSRDMLEVGRRWQQSPFFPRLKFTTAIEYLSQISDRQSVGAQSFAPEDFAPENKSEDSQKSSDTPNSEDKPAINIPVWNDELYLELHRGCYTTHADRKAFNRRGEKLLYEAELWASLATIILGEALYSYPKRQLEEAWKALLFNQFHDILPGTSIPEVFVEADRSSQAVERVGKQILAASLEAIASRVTLPSLPHPDAQPIFVFNSLNWQRSEVVACSVPEGHWEIYDLEGNRLLSQRSVDSELLFLAKDIPSVGYRLFWLCPSQKIGEERQAIGGEKEFILENDKLTVIVDPETGDLSRIFDKVNHKEVLRGVGNQLQSFTDKGQYWDAWNIDPNYEGHPLPPTQLKSIEYLEFGLLQQRIRVVKSLGNSEFCQDYILQIDSPLLKIVTTVDWQETHVLVKAAFPLTLESDRTTYEIPCGAIERTNKPQTEAEKAKWEVYALQWATLTDISQDYGVSLLNDCKYGYDSKPSQLRLTLLRSPQWPDPSSDRGIHRFTYAIYPHRGDWKTAKTVRYGYQLNVPLQVAIASGAALPIAPKTKRNEIRSLPATACFLKISAENLILMALKQSEDDSKKWILRCYECHGKETEFSWESDLPLTTDGSVNLLEELIETISTIAPWKITSISYQLSADPLR